MRCHRLKYAPSSHTMDQYAARRSLEGNDRPFLHVFQRFCGQPHLQTSILAFFEVARNASGTHFGLGVSAGFFDYFFHAFS